jgi:hypothetical protein
MTDPITFAGLDIDPGEDLPAESIDLAAWYLDNLEAELAKDAGWIGTERVLSDLAEIWRNDRPGWIRLEPAMRSARVLAETKAEVKRRARGPLRAVGGESSDLVADVMDDPPVPPDAEIPAGWQVRRHATKGQARLLREVLKRRGDDIVTELVGVASDHVVVSAIMTDVDTGEASLDVAYKAGRRWVHRTIPRAALASSRATAEALSGHSFPVHANNSREMVQWLVDFEARNVAILPRKRIARQMGWQGEGGDDGFIVGPDHLRAEGVPAITFEGADSGEVHLSRCLATDGTLDGWREGAGMLAPYPSVELALYAGLAPVLLKIVRAPNFVVEWSYKTSSGKTTALSLAASLWGNPDPNARESLLASWDMTPVGFERRASALDCLPLIVDDTKRARSYRGGESSVPGVVYEISNGQGRVRGSVDGMAATRYWRTVMLTTGEQRAIDFDRSGGVATRVVSLWGNPFGESSRRVAGVIDQAKRLLYSNFGHAGRRWVEWVAGQQDEWAGWVERLAGIRDEIRKTIDQLDNRPNDAAVTDRLAGNLAVLELTGRLAHGCLELPWEYRSPVDHIVPVAADGAKMADRETEALGLVASHLSANLKMIQGSSEEKDPPPGGWLGWMDGGVASAPWSVVCLYSAGCKRLLEGWGYEPNAILRRWKEAGVIECDKGRVDRKIRIEAGRRVRMVVFGRPAIEQAGFSADDSEAPLPVPF